MATNIEDVVVVVADYHNPEHAKAIESLLGNYANDLMGGGEPLEQAILDTVVGEEMFSK
jgi:hypothetical protein